MTTDIHADTQAPKLADIVHDLRETHARATPGAWGLGQTTHHTVSRRDGQPPYRIAEFHHAKDAAFCDVAHMFVPTILAALEARDAEIRRIRDVRNDSAEEWRTEVRLCRQTIAERAAEIAALESKLRATEATLFEYRKLINERPAVNAGLLSEYQRWTGKVYSLEIINAVDVAIDQARTDGRS